MVAIITRNELTSTKNTATGRKTLTVDGDSVDIGSTGMRDLSGLMNTTYIESGRLLISRTEKQVQLHIFDLILASGAPAAVTLLTNDRPNMASFRPAYPVTGRAIAAEGNMTSLRAPSADVAVNRNSGVVLYGAAAGEKYQASLCWETSNVWPGTLPGVADGDPIGV